MVFTRQQGEDALRHVVTVVMNQPLGGTLGRTLRENEVASVRELIFMEEASIDNLTFQSATVGDQM